MNYTPFPFHCRRTLRKAAVREKQPRMTLTERIAADYFVFVVHHWSSFELLRPPRRVCSSHDRDGCGAVPFRDGVGVVGRGR